jgi:signal transduction histidine kinase
MNVLSDARLLLVDHLPAVHDELRKILIPGRTRMPGAGTAPAAPLPAFQLDCATSGPQGVGLVRTGKLEGRPYALAFVDRQSPVGWDAVRTVEELWREDACLQVVLCGSDSDASLDQSLGRLGMSDRLMVLRKPFDATEVRLLTRALVAKRRLARESSSRLANLEQLLQDVREVGGEMRRRRQDLDLQGAPSEGASSLSAMGMLGAFLSQDVGSGRGDRAAMQLKRLRLASLCSERLIEGLPSLAEIGSAELALETLDVSRLAREVLLQRRSGDPHRMVSISVQEGLRAWGDERLVRLALEHLLDNAWKFTARQEMAAITVGANLDGEGQSVFFVRDSGCGFDPACAGHLFHRFQRLHPPGEFEGGGVGLVAVGRIVERHLGRVWADSRPGQGTTVFFTLPNPAPAPALQPAAPSIRIVRPIAAVPARARMPAAVQGREA